MKKAVLFISCLMLLFASCAKDDKDNLEEKVGNAAQQYYTYLLQGRYDAFVDGCYQKDSIRSSYRAQLIDNAKMFMGQQQKEHQGIKSVEVKSVEVDTLCHTANVFFTMTYGDNTHEQVLLPMVEHDGLWYMR